jgi:TPR repeat protein
VAAPGKAEAEQGAGSESQVPSTAATVPQTKTSELPPPQQSENAESQASAGQAEETHAAPTQLAPKANNADNATPVSKSSKVEARQVAPSATYEDKLVADGERYLYGNGVPQNCDRAQRNLLTAAQHANAKAETLVGAMYATGHCVTRDVPTAYRWFARALRQDPGNTRLARDLEILWKQMTTEERQIVQRGGQ